MVKLYPRYIGLTIIAAYVLLFASSCSKDKKDEPGVISNIAKIGMYQYGTSTGRRVFLPITKVGTVTTAYLSVFDTGSTGMTIDANGILPASMITSNGFVFTGDSVIVNGITVTNQQSVMAYGNSVGGETRQYGNLAYASVTMGDTNGSVTATRIPFFLYYKMVDMSTGNTLPAHSSDVFGVGPGYSYATNKIGSPLSYFPIPNGITNGFRLAKLSSTFNTTLTYVPGLLAIGLTPADLNAGFIMHNLSFSSQGGYSPNIPATINYNGNNVSALMLFDTGNPSTHYVSNQASPSNTLTLPANTTVSVTTGSGFTYQYVTNTTTNSTQVVRPSFNGGDPRTIYNINFFIDNEYLTDYQGHRIGLKN